MPSLPLGFDPALCYAGYMKKANNAAKVDEQLRNLDHPLKDEVELVRGSGNVFRDFGFTEAEALQLKAKMTAKIIGILEDEQLTARTASEKTGIPAAEFTRILNVRLDALSIERLLNILATLGQDVDVSLTFGERTGLGRLRTA